MITRTSFTEGEYPLHGRFLDVLARDIASHPERLRLVYIGLVRLIQSLVGDSVEVELDAPLAADVETGQEG